MNLDADNKTLLELAALGALMAIGKLLVGGRLLTVRLIAGRMIVGAGLSMAACAALALIPSLPQNAVIGIGSALAIAGQSFLELLVQRWVGQSSPPAA